MADMSNTPTTHKAEVEQYLDRLGMVRKDFPDHVVDLADENGTGVLDSYMRFNLPG